MINFKTILGVVIVAVLIGVVYVVFEKNFSPVKSMRDSKTSSAQELSKENPPVQSSVINLPSPQATLPPIDQSSDLEAEANKLEMRDYSGLFEELKKINQ